MSKCEKKLRIAVICESDHLSDPRPNRVIRAFMEECEITAIGRRASEMRGVEVLSYDPPQARTRLEEWRLYFNVFTRNYRPLVYIPTRLKIAEYLQEREFDIIFCHDLVLLPLVLEHKKGAKVVFDAREYYPRQLEDDRRWRLLFAKFNDWLCREYLPRVDYCYTVSKRIAHEYEKNYGVKCDVIMSLPAFLPLEVAAPSNNSIRLIHHGIASSNRKIEGMIEMMDHVDSRFSLDLMLVPTNQSNYFQKLQAMAESRPNVRIIPPVAFEEIVPFISQYDIGISFCPFATFNLKYSLPNKFFEFIQARLAIAIGPSPEMARIVKEENLGIIAPDFKPQSMAKALNALTLEALQRFKENAHKVAPLYSAEENGKRLRGIVSRVLGGES